MMALLDAMLSGAISCLAADT